MTDAPVLIPVPVGDCRCPGTPHGDGDVVSIDKEMGTAAGIAAVSVGTSDEAMTFAQRYGLMVEAAMQLSVRRWTFEHRNGTGKNEPIPIGPETVREQLAWDKGGAEVANAVMKQYGAALGLPFARKKIESQPDSSSTPIGSMESSSTSPIPAGKKKRPKRSA